MSKISVVVPVYKVEKYIKRCIDSILNQSFTDFDLILVDDGSPDNSGQICDTYAEQDSRLHVIHQQNGGLSAARNTGIDWAFDNSDSDWITFIDSDDWVHPQYLEALYNAAAKENVHVAVAAFARTSGEVPFVDIQKLSGECWDVEEFFCTQGTDAVIACSKLCRKKCFEGIRFPEGRLHEDEFTTYKVLFQSQKVSFINQPLYFYYLNDDSITLTKWTPKRLDKILALDERADFFRDNNNIRMYKKSIADVFFWMQHYYKLVQEQEQVHKKDYLNCIRKMFRKMLFKYRRSKPFSKNQMLYSYAYPHLMAIYYRMVRLKR